jgi:hypothetical protein
MPEIAKGVAASEECTRNWLPVFSAMAFESRSLKVLKMRRRIIEKKEKAPTKDTI